MPARRRGTQKSSAPPKPAARPRSEENQDYYYAYTLFDDDDDEEEAIDADGQGVWEHAFCVVCDCLIDAQAAGTTELPFDETTWEATAVSNLPLHRGAWRRHASSGNDAQRSRPRLYCSKRCEDLDRQRATGLQEFVHYLHVPEENGGGVENGSPMAPMSLPPRPPRSASPDPLSMRDVARSLNESALAGAAAPAAPLSKTAALSDLRFGARGSSPAAAADPTPPRSSMLQRALQQPAAETPVPSGPPAPQAPPSVDLYSDSPPRSLVFGAESSLAPAPEPRPASPSVLDLLASGKDHRTRPSSAGPSLHAAEAAQGATAPDDASGAAVTALRRAHASSSQAGPAPNSGTRDAHGLLTSLSSAWSTVVRPGDASGAEHGDTRHPRSDAASPIDVAGRGPKRAANQSAPAVSTPEQMAHSAQTMHRVRSKDIHALPPLLGPPRERSSAGMARSYSRGSRSSTPVPEEYAAAFVPRTPSDARLSRTAGASARTSAWPSRTALASRSATRLATLGTAHSQGRASTMQPGTSPRRAGLGWGALPQVKPPPALSSSYQGARSLGRTSALANAQAPPNGATHTRQPSAESASGTGPSAELCPRTWSYESLPGVKMYPILQLPHAPVHDLYDGPWQSAAMDRSNSSGQGTPHRKSLFYFDG